MRHGREIIRGVDYTQKLKQAMAEIMALLGRRDIAELKNALAYLTSVGERTMTAISDFASAQTAFNDRMDLAVAGITDDLRELNAQIQKLQQSPGAITAEDQALLDDLQRRGETISAKMEALDALTPPEPPA